MDTIHDPVRHDTARRQADHATLSPTEARQAVTFGRMRYVLATSLSLAVMAMIVAWFIF